MRETVTRWTVFALMAFLAAACTINRAGVRRTDTALDLSQRSLALLSVRVEHDYRPKANPIPTYIRIEKAGAKAREDRFFFVVDRDAREAADGPMGHESLVRLAIPPGRYTFVTIEGHGCDSGWFIGPFVMPIVSDVEIPPASVVYLGRVEAHTRKRDGDEFRAAPLLGIDQVVCGWTDSTWEVAIRDAYESDMQRFRAGFPALRGVPVEKRLMTFDRGRAQNWWDASRAVRAIGGVPFSY